MSAADLQLQDEELDALGSILDETTFELHRKSSNEEKTHGILVVEVTVPEEFHVEYQPSEKSSGFVG